MFFPYASISSSCKQTSQIASLGLVCTQNRKERKAPASPKKRANVSISRTILTYLALSFCLISCVTTPDAPPASTVTGGKIINQSGKILWVIIDDHHKKTARLLAPFYQSPDSADIEGVCSADALPISGHRSWWRIIDGATAVIREDASGLSIECTPSIRAQEINFRNLRYDSTPGWGEAAR